MNKNSVRVYVQDLDLQLRIGLLDIEKQAPQRVLVSLSLYAAPDYLTSDGLIDYALVREALVAWQGRPHVELLEALIQEALAIGFDFDAVQAVKVSISKPDIFTDAQQAGLEAYMERDVWTSTFKTQ